MANTDRNAAEIESLYRQHGAALLIFAAAMTGERSGAQDVVHQVFLRLMDGKTLSGVADKKAYLFSCVRNAVLNQSKLRGRQMPLDTEAVLFDPPEKDFAAERNLREALGSLPDDQRQVVILHLWGELTFAQIGELLHISPNTAASRYRYALGSLRDAMSAKENPRANSR